MFALVLAVRIHTTKLASAFPRLHSLGKAEGGEGELCCITDCSLAAWKIGLEEGWLHAPPGRPGVGG